MSVPAAPPARRDRPTTRTPPAAGRRAPVALAAAGALLVGLAALLFNLRIKGFILDETIFKQSAVSYTTGLPGSLIDDPVARATSRLYSLLISPLFALFDGDLAVRLARGLNGLLFATAAIPAYLLARQTAASRPIAACAAVAAVALPWLTLTTAMFSESLAYPLVLGSVCAMAAAFRAPSARRDLLVVVLIGLATGTRTQLFGLALGYLALIAWRLWLDRPRSRDGLPAWARSALRGFPVTALLLVGGVLVLLVMAAQNTLRARLDALLGGYGTTLAGRASWPTDVGMGLGVEVLAIAIGVGVVPAILALAYWPRAAAGRLGDGPRAAAAAIGCGIVALFAFTMYGQGGFWGAITEERYYFYAAPMLWIGALAAAQARSVRRRDLLEVGLALALLAAVLPLPRTLDVDPETSFFAPVMSATGWLLGKLQTVFGEVTGREGPSHVDALAAIIAGASLLLWWLWRRTPRTAFVALGAAAVVQVGLLLTAFYAIDGNVHGVPGRVAGPPYSELGFVDRAIGDRSAWWFTNSIRSDQAAIDSVQRVANVYNDRISQRLELPALGLAPENFPLSAKPLANMSVDANGGVELEPRASGPPFAVAQSNSPLAQLEGASVARTPTYGLEVQRLAEPLRLRWLATGTDPVGKVDPGESADLRAWGDRNVTLRLTAAGGAARARVTLGGDRRKLALGAGEYTDVSFTTCGAARGRLRVSGGAVILGAAILRPGRCD